MKRTPSRGGLKNLLIHPGEDPQEYENLKAGLFEEYKPVKRLEVEIMTSIATSLWRLRRIQRSRLNKKVVDDTQKPNDGDPASLSGKCKRGTR